MSSHEAAGRPRTSPPDLEDRCELLRSLHVPGRPLLLANAWDAASARAVVEAGFPVVATTSGGVAASLGFEDHEQAPAEAMLGAAARIATAVDAPVTVDAEAGYGMSMSDLVARLREMGAAGCNLEDTDHAASRLREPAEQADRLHGVRAAATDLGYGLVINARIDVFLPRFASERGQSELVDAALERAHAYLQAGADCVFPIFLYEPDALRSFVAGAGGPVNVLQLPAAPTQAELGRIGVARISYGGLLQHYAMEQLGLRLQALIEG